MKPKKIYLNIKTLVDTCAIVLVWRGLWILFDLYVFPDNPILSAILGIIVGLGILLYDDRLLSKLE